MLPGRCLTLMRLDAVTAAVDLVGRGLGVPADLTGALFEELRAALPSGRQHPLGFIHIDLNQLMPSTYTIRLHVWDSQSVTHTDAQGRLHDHTWELRSAVLVGALIDVQLTASRQEDGDFVASRVIYGSAGNSLQSLDGHWALNEGPRRAIAAGSHYTLPPHVVHRTDVLNLPTATLVVAVEHGGPGPVVYSPREAPSAVASSRISVDTSRIVAALDLAAATLG